MTGPRRAHRDDGVRRTGPRLVALDLPGGPGFVDALRRVWARGDAAFPVDQRLPHSVKADQLRTMAPSAVIDANGDATKLTDSRLVEPGDALVVATSGSTGRPKGVVLTHDAVIASAHATNERLAVTDDDHWLACLPLAHVGGLSAVTRAIVAETRLTVLAGFDAQAVADAVRTGGVTLVSLVATALRRVDASLFRMIVLGGASPPAELPTNVVTTYGMTETGSGVVYGGRPLRDVEVRLDDDAQIHVRAPMLLRAYRDGTVPLDANGWFATGDIGSWLPHGCLAVEGRAGDLIVTGGDKVWPEPVEAVLRDHPAVGDVVVAGRPDPEWGHAVTAYVVAVGTPPTLDGLRGLVKAQLPAYCAPRHLVLVDAIPRTALGKPRRALLPPSPT